MIGRTARFVIAAGVAAALAGCSLAKAPVPIDERATGSARGQAVAAVAKRYVGAPYRWGGSSPSGFDCSGLVRYVYAQVGVALPHNAAEQYRLGTPVAREDLEPGDLVFFDRLRHDGIYVGAGRFVHARQTGRHVGIASLDDEWYASHFVGARRLEPPEAMSSFADH
jgi:cell wall-associated NlpC family hydrolase